MRRVLSILLIMVVAALVEITIDGNIHAKQGGWHTVAAYVVITAMLLIQAVAAIVLWRDT